MVKTFKKTSVKMSYLLRHNPDGLIMSKDGWVNLDDLSKKLNASKHFILEIVDKDEKKRYSVSSCGSKIRANQGHSIDVKINFKKKIPPKTLYHGTSLKNLSYIRKTGIKPMTRQFVHLSDNQETASIVGKRHSKNEEPCILEVDCVKMVNDKIDFFLSENDVWLVDYVDKKYLKNI